MNKSIDRFSMAASLVARARAHQLWIGDDHGDRYEEAMYAGVITDEMQIVVKETLDHLRAALDYCAQQIWQHFSGAPQGARVYFPIAAESGKESDFLSLMNRNMPGVSAASPAAFDMLKSFQVFSDAKNNWLPELATLVNQTKHDHLEVASIPNTLLNVSAPHSDSLFRQSFVPGHGPKRGQPWMKIKATPREFAQGGTYEVVFLQLKAIRMELSDFLKEAIAGVDNISAECRKLVP